MVLCYNVPKKSIKGSELNMARPRKLLNAQTGNLTKDIIAERKQEEEKLYNYEKLDFGIYPPSLLPQAYDEWDRIANYIGELPLSELDQNTLVRYCNYTYLYAETAKLVAEQGVITPEGKANPAVNAMNSYSKELKSATNDLGLTINSRLRIINPAEKEKVEDDAFGDMLSMVRDGSA